MNMYFFKKRNYKESSIIFYNTKTLKYRKSKFFCMSYL